jgi:hypothetical protein
MTEKHLCPTCRTRRAAHRTSSAGRTSSWTTAVRVLLLLAWELWNS